MKERLETYLNECRLQKNLNMKTIKAYSIDLKQFLTYSQDRECSRELLNDYIGYLSGLYSKPRTIKRKIASLKAFFNYLELDNYIEYNPFNKIRFKYKEPLLLPRTVDLQYMTLILKKAYDDIRQSRSPYEIKTTTRNAAVIELLFSTGLRVSELCNIKKEEINLDQGQLLIYGKGAKERNLYIGNYKVLQILKEYACLFQDQIDDSIFFFINRNGNRLSEQSVRFILKHYERVLKLNQHITPHMLRHTFATQLLEEDVDIRYIQRILGHSSITTTQIYTHVTSNKQREILIQRNPRNRIPL
ncbi:MAG: tyrosine-type recombinase/integrase [Beduini sp.]|uniref:tyrosine-type recombinase/integrase n=1 Tax=Beduini sp. TaxID=1922300 RepID=UPI0011CAB007